jgi:hypothetical protein
MKPGDTFHLADFAGGHINFVLEVFPDGSVITCNFTDYSNHSDKTCVVEVGEHPNITKKSIVNFPKAHHCEAGAPMEALARLIQGYKKSLSPELLARIRQAALVSPRTADKIKEALKQKK